MQRTAASKMPPPTHARYAEMQPRRHDDTKNARRRPSVFFFVVSCLRGQGVAGHRIAAESIRAPILLRVLAVASLALLAACGRKPPDEDETRPAEVPTITAETA